MKSLHKYLPKRILPSQYGGTAGDLFEINGWLDLKSKSLLFYLLKLFLELWRNELISNKEYLHELENCGANVSLMNQFKKQDKNNPFQTTSGTYRKLNND